MANLIGVEFFIVIVCCNPWIRSSSFYSPNLLNPGGFLKLAAKSAVETKLDVTTKNRQKIVASKFIQKQTLKTPKKFTQSKPKSTKKKVSDIPCFTLGDELSFDNDLFIEQAIEEGERRFGRGIEGFAPAVLGIIRGNGTLPIDKEVLDSVRTQCEALYPNLIITEEILRDEFEDESSDDDDDDDDENQSDEDDDRIDIEKEDFLQSPFFDDKDVVRKGIFLRKNQKDPMKPHDAVAFGFRRHQPSRPDPEGGYDPQLIEMIIEYAGTIVKLISKRSRGSPINVQDPKLMKYVMDSIADVMDHEKFRRGFDYNRNQVLIDSYREGEIVDCYDEGDDEHDFGNHEDML